MAKKVKEDVKLSPSLFNKLNSRGKEVEIKFGFAKWTDFELSDEDYKIIVGVFEEMELFDEYFDIPANKKNVPSDLVAVIVYTSDKKNMGYISNNKKNSDVAMGISEANSQCFYIKNIKSEAAPNNKLSTWMTIEQGAALQPEAAYLFIGILQEQWSRVKLDENGNKVPLLDATQQPVLDTEGNPKYEYENFDSEPKDQDTKGKAYEGHSLNLVRAIGG